MVDRGFSVQMSDHNKFGRIPVDQTIEETVNRDTQTSGTCVSASQFSCTDILMDFNGSCLGHTQLWVNGKGR